MVLQTLLEIFSSGLGVKEDGWTQMVLNQGKFGRVRNRYCCKGQKKVWQLVRNLEYANSSLRKTQKMSSIRKGKF